MLFSCDFSCPNLEREDAPKTNHNEGVMWRKVRAGNEMKRASNMKKHEVLGTEAARSHSKFATSKLTANCTTNAYKSMPKDDFCPLRSKLAVVLVLSILALNGQVGAQINRADESVTPTAIIVDQTSTVTPSGPEVVSTTTEFTNADGTISSEPSSSLSAANHASKVKPVNFTLVDEIFESSALNDTEVVRRWKHMDVQIQDGMKAILKLLFPQIVAISQDAKVSGDCSGGILKWILNLRNLRSWAIKMLDATGKPTAGIFEGSLTMFGNYRQCLNIRAPDEDEIEITDQFEEYFRGQFCVIHLKPWMPAKRPFYNLNSTIQSLLRDNYKYYEKTLYDELAEIAIAFNFLDIRMDLCVPSTCTMADIQRVAELLSKKLEMRAKVMRCDVAPREIDLLQSIDKATAFWLGLFIALISLAFLGSLLSLFLKTSGHRRVLRIALICRCLSIGHTFRSRFSFCRKKNEISANFARNPKDTQQSLAFQATSSSRMVDSTSSSEDGEDCKLTHELSSSRRMKPIALYGLRSLFVFWFIIVQMTVELKYQYLRESLTLRHMLISYWPLQIVVNSTLLFESLVVITAFTLGYSCLESKTKDLVAYIVDKYVRLILPVIALVTLTVATPLLAIDSPVWRNFVEQQSLVCKSTGHLNFFFLQNFIAYDKMCLPHSWLICVELQLIVLSIPMLLLLKKDFLVREDSFIIANIKDKSLCLLTVNAKGLFKSKVGLLGILFTLVGFAINFFIVYTNQLPPSWFYTFPDVAQKNYYFGFYLSKTWSHMGVFAMGLLAGHLCRSAINMGNLRLLKTRQSPQQPSPVSSSSVTSDPKRVSNSDSTLELEVRSSNETMNSDSQCNDNSTKERRERERISRIRTSLILGATICMLAIIFSTFSWSTNEGPSNLIAGLYDASSRFLWSLALICIMIQLCLKQQSEEETNQTSWISRLLSHPGCIYLSRLSLLAYLLAPFVHTFILAVEEQSLFPSLFIMFHVIVGNIVIIYVLAFILSITIEQPIRRLINHVLLSRGLPKQFELNQKDKIQVIT